MDHFTSPLVDWTSYVEGMLIMVNYQDKKVVIIGLGLTGLSCVNFFLKRSIKPRVMDTRTFPPCLEQIPKWIECHLGSFNNDWLLAADLIVITPGISLMHPSLNGAINAGIEIIGDIELFCREAEAPIIAITGSNGKSTVTTLIGEIAKAAGVNVNIGGNLGIPALMLLDDTCELYILELSSFQLETTYSLQAIAATILNITEDHIDRYPSGLKQYQSAKLRVYENARACIFNIDDKLTMPMFNVSKCYISFGINTGDYRLNHERGEIYLQVKDEKILNVKEMKLSGQHNYINALATLALADVIGVPRKTSLKILAIFPGLAHRFQLVLERNNIRWINDSKATNVRSTEAALNSLQINGTIYLLLGGKSKSADFSPLQKYLTDVRIQPYCFGNYGEILEAMYFGIVKKTETMEQAIREIVPQLRPGDVVLLSPACASFDQFKNFEQRGDVFTYLAKKLG